MVSFNPSTTSPFDGPPIFGVDVVVDVGVVVSIVGSFGKGSGADVDSPAVDSPSLAAITATATAIQSSIFSTSVSIFSTSVLISVSVSLDDARVGGVGGGGGGEVMVSNQCWRHDSEPLLKSRLAGVVAVVVGRVKFVFVVGLVVVEVEVGTSG